MEYKVFYDIKYRESNICNNINNTSPKYFEYNIMKILYNEIR